MLVKPFKAVKAVSTLSQHDPFKDWELQKVQSWLSQRAQQHDLAIEPDALWALTEHCGTHLRFRKNCPDCLRVVGAL